MAVPSTVIRTYIRQQVGDTGSAYFTDDEIDDLWDLMAEEYSGNVLIRQAVVASLLGARWSSAVEEVTYALNEERESLSDKAKALEKRYAEAKKRLAELEEDGAGSAARIGRGKVVPSRRKEWPDA